MIAAMVIAFPLATLAAFKPGSWIDRLALFFSLLGLSMPNFWLGPMLMILVSIQFGWLPVSGRGGFAHLILPSITLGMAMAAILTRILRSSLLSIINLDFIKTARAKGLGEPLVWLKHMLRNALIPVISIMGLQFGSLRRFDYHRNHILVAWNWPAHRPSHPDTRLSARARLCVGCRHRISRCQFYH